MWGLVVVTTGLVALTCGPTHSQVRHNTAQPQLQKNSTQNTGLFPVVFNLATNADISVNATCGEVGPETYCKIVEHVRRRRVERIQCGICDANNVDPEVRHPIENAIDGSQRWWQSPTIANGWQYNWITITLDLRQVYQVAYVILKAANSPRPGNWVLERSLDGETYKPWQYYAISDAACWTIYGVAPTVGIPYYRTDDQVLCTSHYSRLDPLENGEIHTSLVNGRPGVDGPSDTLREFTTARYVRLRFQRIRTLNADLMSFMVHDPRTLDETVTNRYYYSVKDISIGGQCICFGHARFCPRDAVTGELSCQCEQNTCGKSCEHCCPMFNQQPWRPGTYQDSGNCEECNCFGHATECVYNETVAMNKLSLNLEGVYKGGGVCIDCKHNTGGINCQTCIDGFFRPKGVDARLATACMPCNCRGPGARGTCIKDEKMGGTEVQPGTCLCRQGFCGPKCEECASGYRGYPNCQPCPCSREGSLNLDTCEGQCVCKAQVYGAHCDQCQSEYYNLQASNPQGCTPCFCFTRTRTCKSSTWRRTPLMSLEGWQISDMGGTGVTKPTRANGYLTINMSDTSSLDRVLYWQAPRQFLGNQLLAYGGELEYVIYYTLNTSLFIRDAYIANTDLVLQSGDIHLGYSGRYYRELTENVAKVNMTEGGWYHIEGSSSPASSPVTRPQFMTALANVERLLVRATYHIYQQQARLVRIAMDVADVASTSGPVMSAVEVCDCPPGYAGLSCEMCSPGFYRVKSAEGSRCVPCQCNGHTDQCDEVTGVCRGCAIHFTAGDHCERCMAGYHGDATDGTAKDCKPCACPLQVRSNNFARSCRHLPGRDKQQAEYICEGCREGHEGSFCDLCSDGYFGNPLVPGNFCQPCQCHGNIDPQVSGSCDRFTGRCVKCMGNTEGSHCERCKEGYFGTALNRDCQKCQCNHYGAEGAVCNATTGQCSCRPLYTGQDCGQCQAGYGNIVEGCLPCQCSGIGSSSQTCDPVSGACHCKAGVTGHRCEKCQQGYYRYTQQGCTACRCDKRGSDGKGCDAVTGQCLCKSHVIGQFCNQCETGYWGLAAGQGCTACQCNIEGAIGGDCDVTTGQCQCKPGVTGLHCDQCQVGYFGFSDTGCRKCAECRGPGQVCDPVSGSCMCPGLTEGEFCDQCVANAWGYRHLLGCKQCNCSAIGSMTSQCDLVTGRCLCQPQFSGRHCDHCNPGHSGFPNCRPCNCHIPGTQADKCDSKVCSCDDMGQCPCKSNTEGRTCDTCKPGTFSLEATNPQGCTACFCFQRATRCQQAAYTWTEISVPGRRLELDNQSRTIVRQNSQGLLVVPLGVSTVQVVPKSRDQPLYWALPAGVLGDMTTSYGGILKFMVYYRLAPTAQPPLQARDRLPLVMLAGNSIVRLKHFNLTPRPGGANIYKIHIQEAAWTDESGNAVSRETLMVALQKVESLLVRAAYHSDIVEAQLRSVSIEKAVPGNDSTPTAFGIEQCDCPVSYEGLSCQNPAVGYFRQKPKNVTDKNLVALIGESVQCNCHGHSDHCSQENGVCMNCSHNTRGDHCELCDQGYHGDASVGSPYDCQPCACPLVAESNNFSPTCRHAGTGYICDACQPRYSGPRCDRCSDGYYGNPLVLGQRCEPCNCNQDGSVNNICDPVTGQCVCRSGIHGRTCNRCGPKYAMVDGRCQSCERGCTGLIMQQVDVVERESGLLNITAASLVPWQGLDITQNRTTYLRGLVPVGQLDLSGVSQDLELARQQVSWQVRQEKPAATRAEKLKAQAGVTMNSALQLYDEVRQEDVLLRRSLQGLARLVEMQLRNQSGHIGDIGAALEAADRRLQDVQSRQFQEAAVNGEDEHRRSRGLHSLMKVFAQRSINVTRRQVKVDDAVSRLKDLGGQVRTVEGTTGDTEAGNKDNRKTMRRIQDIYLGIQNNVTAVEQELTGASQNTRDCEDTLWNQTSTNYQASLKLKDDLSTSSNLVEVKAGLLEQSLPDARPKLLRAQMRASNLKAQAAQVDSQFSGARLAAEDPLKAAKVYQNMAQAIDKADVAVRNASLAAQNAQQQAELTPGGPLQKQARSMLTTNTKLLTQAKEAKEAKDQGLSDLMKELEARTSLISQNNEDTQKVLDAVKLNLVLNNINLQSKVVTAVNKSSATVALVETMGKRGVVMEEKLTNELNPRLQQLKQEQAGGEIMAAMDAVTDAGQASQQLENMTETMEGRLQQLRVMRSRVQQSLKELRDNIRLARQQANTIKVSLKAKGSCVRRYEPPVEPSTSTTIILHFQPSNTKQNMLLLLLRSSVWPDYIALELVNGKVRLLWNNGGGTKVIKHSLTVTPSGSSNKWYRVKAERVGNVGRLSVQLVPVVPVTDPLELMDSSTPSHVTLDVDRTGHLYIGGVPQTYQLPGGVQSSSFSGCIGGVYINGEHMGVYNFRQLEGQDQCKGCEVPPPPFDTETGTYQFDGTGFARTTPIRRYSSQQMAVSFEFKAFWEDALLFLSQNKDTGDYFAVELRGGHVVFTVDLGGGTRSRTQSRRKYNTNRWVQVNAQRSALEGILQVDEEVRRGHIPPGGQTSLDLKNKPLLFAGVPPGVDTYSLNVTNTSLIGCLRQIQLSSRSFYTQSLLEGDFAGMDAGCRTKKARVIGFEGDGHVELAGKDLPRDASVSFSFRTLQADAFLLLALGTNSQDYYSFALSGGQMDARFNGGSGEAWLNPRQTYNDGYLHSVSVVKTNRLLEMRIDDQLVETARLPSGSSRIDNMKGNKGGLYVGGVPAGLDVTSKVASTVALKGCIRDLAINGHIQAMDQPVNFSRADVGRCDSARLFPDLPPRPTPVMTTLPPGTTAATTTVFTPPTTTTRIPPTACAVDGSYALVPKAVAFGDIIRSHADIVIKRKEVTRDFSLHLDFRTYYTSGLIFYITNEAQTEYVAVQLSDSRLVVSYDDKGTATDLISQGDLNDGEWHTLQLNKTRRNIRLQVDDGKTQSNRIMRKLDVIAPIYVGGLPKVYQARKGLVSQSFKGCMRNFHLNKRFVDVLNSKAIMGVGVCYRDVEKGIYFDSYGFAVFSDRYRINNYFSVTLEFRTVKENGILISTSHPKGKPALALELMEGRLKFTARNFDGTFTAESNECRHCLCDNRWHKVTARYEGSVVQIKVDNSKWSFGFLRGAVQALNTNFQLFIGGYSIFAEPQGAASSNTKFNGCMKNVQVNDTLVDWHSCHRLVDVHVGACPISIT